MIVTNVYKLFAAVFILVAIFSCSKTDIEEVLQNNEFDDEEITSRALDQNDLELWKITFPVNSAGVLSGNSDAAENKDLKDFLSNNTNDPYFFENGAGDKLSFHAPHNGATTSNSGGVRCELRERELTSNGGTVDTYWDGSNTFNVMEFRMRVREVPNSNRLTFVQIHDKDSTLDDVIQIGVKPNSADNNNLWVTVQGSIITGSGQNAQYEPLFKYDIGDWERMKLQCNDNEVKIKRRVNGSFQTIFVKNIQEKWPNEDMDEEYYKAGCYLQGSPSDGYGEVQFSKLKLVHSN